jgi:hypothetical protein
MGSGAADPRAMTRSTDPAAGAHTRKRVAPSSIHAPSAGRQTAGASSADRCPGASTSFLMGSLIRRFVPLELRDRRERDVRPLRSILQLVAQFARGALADEEIEQGGDVLAGCRNQR